MGGPVYLPKLYNGKNKTFFFVDFDYYSDLVGDHDDGERAHRAAIDGRLFGHAAGERQPGADLQSVFADDERERRAGRGRRFRATSFRLRCRTRSR